MVITSAKLLNKSIFKFKGIDSIKVTMDISIADVFLLNFVCAIKDSTGPSNMFIEELIAANNTLKKNNTISICPPGIALNIVGIVINNSGGPDAGSNPKANTAGIITKEANNAAMVSSIAVLTADLGISKSFLM